MKKVHSSLTLFKAASTSKTLQQANDQNDLPRPPAPNGEMQTRLQKLDQIFATAKTEVETSRTDILTRRSKLFESVDPVLLVLKLLPQELSNIHTCVKQALSWDFLTDESKASFEIDVQTICREISFALQHFTIAERNESLDARYADKLAYRASEKDLHELQRLVMAESSDSGEMLKMALRGMFPLESNLQRAVEGVEMCLRSLTKTRIRYKRLLYEAMDNAIMVDETLKKGGVAMSVLLHPSWG